MKAVLIPGDGIGKEISQSVAVGPFNAHLYSLIASTSPGSKTSFVLAAYSAPA